MQHFSPGFIVEVVGNVGSGKTTLAKKMANQSNLLYADTDLYISNPFLPLYPKDPQRWAFVTGVQFSYKRSQIVPEINSLLSHGPLVLDQGFDMGIHVYSKNCLVQKEMIPQEWDLLQKIHQHLMQKAPIISASIYIDIPIKIIMKRLKERGRLHEQLYTASYIRQIQKRVEEYIKYLVNSQKRKAVIHIAPNQIITIGKQVPELNKLISQIC